MKSLITTAVLAACAGAAMAQSSNVTIYGRVDVGVTRQNDGSSALAGGNGASGAAGERWDVRPGSSSRLGLRITEDLGGGLSAGAVLEHRFNPDTGAQQNANVFWNGRSIVQLSAKDAGTVYLGRDYLPAYNVADALDPFGGDTVGRVRDDLTLAGYRVDGDVRSSNTVGWRSPSWSGFSAQLAVSAGEGSRTQPANKRALGGTIAYAAGPLYAAFGADQVDGNNQLWLLGASYDFGVVKPMLAYTSAELLGVKRTNITLGATAPLGNGRAKAVVARLDPDGGNNNLTKFALGYEYFLSKRTSVYADVGTAKRQGLTRTTAVDAGIKHNF